MSVFKDKVLLITGGTGSFGNAVLRRFLDSDIKEIRILSRDEKKQDDMRHFLQANRSDVAHKVKFFIGNVRQREAVDFAMDGVDYVFSAAALKQVPSCEFFPMEAVRTNVEGTNNVLLSAIAHGVKNVVVLSTDKAAYPINAMGISKAMMEMVAIAAQLDATNISLTPLSKKGKTEKYMKNAKTLAVSFAITKNVTASNGTRSVYVRVTTPEGEVLNGGGTFEYSGKQLAWSMKKDVEYTGEETALTLYCTVNEYLGGGQYNVSIFCDGQAIGSRNFTYNK